MDTDLPTLPQTKPHTRSAADLLPKVLIGLALAAFVGYLIVYVIYAVQLFRFPFDYDQGEGFELMDTILFSRGEWPYRDNDAYPFYSSNYPPLFHVVVVPLIWLFGPQYWTGRLVSFLGTLVTAGAIAYAVGRGRDPAAGRGRWWLAALSGLAFLASNYVYHVGPLFRQHMFMVMFETLAVVLLTVIIEREENDGRRRNVALLGVMALLLFAGYTKQLAYATVIAVFIFLFLRGPRRAIVWGVPLALVTGLVFLGINVATDGQWLLNTITANINPFVPGQAEGLFRQWFGLHTVIITAAAVYAAYQLYATRLSAYAIWFVVATVNSVTAGKWGAGESYFATAIAAACILAGLAFNHLLDWSRDRSWPSARAARWAAVLLPSLIAALYLWQARLVFHMPTHTPALAAVARVLGQPEAVMIAPQTSCSLPRAAEAIPYVDAVGATLLGRPPTAADTLAGRQIAALIAEGDTAAFSEDAGFNLYLGRDVVTNPTQLLNLYNNNAVDLTEMLAMLDAQAFDTIVLRAQFYPPPVLDVIGQRYETTHLVQMNGFVYCVMRPPMNQYRVELPVFSGPLDLLLHLIEREELDITAVSLVQVTGQYLDQVRQLDEEQLEGLIDFIGIGARLLLIKSRALLPRPPVLPGADEDEEDPTEALLRQLRDYKRFKTAAQWLDSRHRHGLRTYLRVAPPPRLEGRLDLSGVDGETLLAALHAVLARTQTMEQALSVARPRTLTIEEQLQHLRGRLGRGKAFLFNDVLVNPRDRTEVAVTLLALLELIKRREASAAQSHLFGPIEIVATQP